MNNSCTVNPGAESMLPESSQKSYRKFWVAMLVLLISVIGGAGLLYGLHLYSIKSVRIVGDWKHLNRAELQTVIAPYLDRSLFEVGTSSIRAAVLSLPWVKQASVRIVWPDSLALEVTERQVIARWGDQELIEDSGGLFRPKTFTNLARLPRLDGPPQTHRQVLSAWHRVRVAFDLFRSSVLELRLLSSGEWVIAVEGGITLITDSTDPASVFITYGDALLRLFGPQLAGVERIDFRYPNGFAVTSKQQPQDQDQR